MSLFVFSAILALSMLVAFLARRGKIRNNMHEIMVASRSFGAVLVFFVAVGETYSIATMIGVPGAIYSKGAVYALWFLGYILLGFAVGYFINPMIWRVGRISGAMTMPDCFGWRFGSKSLEVLVALITIAFLLPWMQMQFAGLGAILRHMGWSMEYSVGVAAAAVIAYFYIAVAGIRAPAWVSIMKDILMVMIIVAGGLVAMEKMPGGISGIFDEAVARFPQHVTIAAAPVTQHVTFTLSTIIFQAMGVSMVPFLFQFIFSAQSEDTVRRNQIFMPLYMYMYPFLIIAAYYVLISVENLERPDESFMALVTGNLPPWAVGAAGAGGALTCIILVSVCALCLGGTFSKNIWGVFRRNAAPRETLVVTNIATAGSLLISVLLAVSLPNLMLGIINVAYLSSTQCFPAAVATLFCPGATRQGVLAGLCAGIIAVCVFTFFDFAFFGINKGLVAMSINTAVMIAICLMTRADTVAQSTIRAIQNFEDDERGSA